MNQIAYRITLVCFFLLFAILIYRLGFLDPRLAATVPIMSNTLLLSALMLLIALAIAPSLVRPGANALQKGICVALIIIFIAALIYWQLAVYLNKEYQVLSDFMIPIGGGFRSQLTYFALFLLLLPLTLPLKGLLNQSHYTFQWTIYLSLFYFLHGVTDTYSLSEQRWPALVQTLVSVLLFVFLIISARSMGRDKQTKA